MGGPGSGNHWNHNGKSTTDDYRRLDVRWWLAREGLLKPGSKNPSRTARNRLSTGNGSWTAT